MVDGVANNATMENSNTKTSVIHQTINPNTSAASFFNSSRDYERITKLTNTYNEQDESYANLLYAIANNYISRTDLTLVLVAKIDIARQFILEYMMVQSLATDELTEVFKNINMYLEKRVDPSKDPFFIFKRVREQIDKVLSFIKDQLDIKDKLIKPESDIGYIYTKQLRQLITKSLEFFDANPLLISSADIKRCPRSP